MAEQKFDRNIHRRAVMAAWAGLDTAMLEDIDNYVDEGVGNYPQAAEHIAARKIMEIAASIHASQTVQPDCEPVESAKSGSSTKRNHSHVPDRIRRRVDVADQELIHRREAFGGVYFSTTPDSDSRSHSEEAGPEEVHSFNDATDPLCPTSSDQPSKRNIAPEVLLGIYGDPIYIEDEIARPE